MAGCSAEQFSLAVVSEQRWAAAGCRRSRISSLGLAPEVLPLAGLILDPSKWGANTLSFSFLDQNQCSVKSWLERKVEKDGMPRTDRHLRVAVPPQVCAKCVPKRQPCEGHTSTSAAVIHPRKLWRVRRPLALVTDDLCKH